MELRGHSQAVSRGLSPPAFSFLSVTPSEQSSLTILSEAEPVTASHATLLRCPAQCMLGEQRGSSQDLSSGSGVPGFQSGPRATLAELPDFSVPLSYICK